MLTAWKRSPESDNLSDTVKEALPEELNAHLERLVNWRLPEFPAKQAEEAIQDCVRRLEERRKQVEKLASTALVAATEEEVGASTLVEAAMSDIELQDETMKDRVGVLLRDQEMGQSLKGQKREEDGGGAAETIANG